jgi:hypothetical protein
MSRRIITHTEKAKSELRLDSEAVTSLSRWIGNELVNSLSARKPLEAVWRECLRQYEGVPKRPYRNYPIENAPNTEITIGAIAVDSIYAQAIDLKWLQTSLLMTCRSVGNDEDSAKNAAALQRFANWVALHEADARQADDLATLDDIMLGTGIFYIPFVEHVKKTRTATITSRGPRIIAIPPEDCIVPGGSYGDVENLSWIAVRFWLSEDEINERGVRNNWNLGLSAPTGSTDWVRTRREIFAKHQKGLSQVGSFYDVFDFYCYYDIDGDGEREDLYVIYCQSADTILHVAYNPFDYRPIVPFRYQVRPHVFWGLGALEMIAPYEEVLTDVQNEATANMILANERLWVGREGAIPSNMRLRRGKIILTPTPKEDLIPLVMADIYPSAFNVQAQLMMLAERRVGVNEMSNPRASSVMGSRTPGITALTLMQQVNRRFTPAFDGMRQGLGMAVQQCMYRYQERLLAGDDEIKAHIVTVLGSEDGLRVITVLSDRNFDEAFTVELTASNPSTNREADRQNAVMLTNILERYYSQAIQLTMMAANPQVPQQVRDVAVKIAEKAEVVIDRVIRTFDQVRDPSTFVLDISAELSSLEEQAPADAMAQLGMLGQAAGGGGLGGMPPPPLGIPAGGIE